MKRLGKGTGEGEIKKAKEEIFFFFFLKNWAKGKIGKKNHNSISITVQLDKT